MSLISLAEYAKKHGRDPATCRQMAIRGGFQTARKIGRNWVIDSEEPYPDRRRKADVTADVTDVMKKDKDFSTVAAVSLSRMECM